MVLAVPSFDFEFGWIVKRYVQMSTLGLSGPGLSAPHRAPHPPPNRLPQRTKSMGKGIEYIGGHCCSLLHLST